MLFCISSATIQQLSSVRPRRNPSGEISMAPLLMSRSTWSAGWGRKAAREKHMFRRVYILSSHWAKGIRSEKFSCLCSVSTIGKER